MRLIATRSVRRLKPGDIFERPDGVANVLIRRGIARLYEPPPPPPKPKPKRRQTSDKAGVANGSD